MGDPANLEASARLLQRYRSVLEIIAMNACKHLAPIHPRYDPNREFCATCEARKVLGWPRI